MIAFDFSYHQPTSVKEAIDLYKDLQANGKSIHYISGGTEFISRARRNEIQCDAVIDLKNIPETNQMEWVDDTFIIGACCSLSSLVNDGTFPLLSDVARKIATQTERNKITIGGNVTSHLPYKEAMMPFLLADSDIVIASEEGMVKQPLSDLYQKGHLLKDEAFIVQFITNRQWIKCPFTHFRETKQSQINYPVISLATLEDGKDIRMAISGLIDYPFRSQNLKIGNENINHMMDNILDQVPETPVSDLQAADDYRLFVLKRMIHNILTTKGAS